MRPRISSKFAGAILSFAQGLPQPAELPEPNAPAKRVLEAELGE